MFPIFLAILAILVIVMNQLTSGLVGASSGASGGALPRRSSGPAGPTTSIKLWIQNDPNIQHPISGMNLLRFF